MSQEPPNSQPPLSPKLREQSEPTVNKESQTPQNTNRAQSVLKIQSIKALRSTIGVLQGLVEKLETPAAATLSADKKTREPFDYAQGEPSFLDKLQLGWSAALGKIRSFLPENLNQKLSDTALTGFIAGIAVILVWTTSVIPGKPSEIANLPPSEQVPPANITTPPELTAPAEPQPIEITPPPEPVPTQPPTLELTPEQNLIASIENQVAEISSSYADGLIQSIQANFQGSRLIIKIAQDWYNLKESQQDKLATQMLEKARELDFSQVEITDSKGTLVARSPVVGTDMVILKRQILAIQEQEALSLLIAPNS